MKLVYAGCSRKGLVRGTNEDAYLMRATDQAGLFLVADGIGGREHGEIVSGMLRDEYDRWWSGRPPDMDGAAGFQSAIGGLKQILFEVNRRVIMRFGERSAGSTLVLLYIFRGQCMLLSAGDSRIYRARGPSFQQMTTDDVYENFLDGAVEFEAASVGKLMGAVGIRSTPEFSVRTIPLRKGDRFFLCSDGVYRYIPARKLQSRVMFNPYEPRRIIEGISRIVEANGAGDNYSMIYVKVLSA